MEQITVQKLFILIMALTQSNVQCAECSDLSRKVADVTEVINAAMVGAISKEYFISSLKIQTLGDINLSPRIREVTGMYNTGCSNVKWCRDQIHQVINFAENVIEDHINFTLLISLTLDINNQNHSVSYLGSTELLSPQKTMILFRLPSNVTCPDVKTYVESSGRELLFQSYWKTQFDEMVVLGLGYSEDLLGCKPLKEVLIGTSFNVLFLTYGNTMLIPESYGIFKKTMDSFHEKNLKLVGKIPTPLSYTLIRRTTFYFPMMNDKQSESYKPLLIQFGTKWIEHMGCDSYIILPGLMFEKEVKAFKTFSLSTYVRPRNMWHAPRALHIVTKHFESIFIMKEDWDLYTSKDATELHKEIQTKPLFNRSIDVIIDLQHINRKSIPNSANLENDFLETILSNPLEHIAVKTLLFTIIASNSRYSANVNEHVVRRISEDFTLGCKYTIDNSKFNQSSYILLVESLVNACKRINGSIYVLYSNIDLEDTTKNPNKYYTNVVRKRMETLKVLRNHVLNRHKKVSVYIHFDLSTPESSNPNTTLFCNINVLATNEYYEAIATWGKLNDLPIILKTNIDPVATPETTSWFSYLRPIIGSPEMSAVLPFFVLRNYPNNINNWTTDPCIEWTTVRPTVGPSFFHDPNVGAIYRTSMRNTNYTLPDFSYNLMLQFVFNRFQSAEVVIGSNWGYVFETFSKLITKETFNNKGIYFNYDSYHQLDNIKDLFVSFLSLLKQLQSSKLPNILGVHINLSEIFIKLLQGDETLILETNTLWETVASTSRELNISLGILVSSSSCMKVNRKFAMGTLSANFKLLGLTNYIVCNDQLKLTTEDTIDSLGGRFDTHLYLKNGIKECWPRLTTIFRTEVAASLDESSVLMDRYVTLLSHFQKFANAYNTKYFLVEAFDSHSGLSNGWWSIKNYEDLSNPITYIEKEAEYSKSPMWFPRAVNENSSYIFFTTFEVIVIAAAVVVTVIVVSGIIIGYVYMRYRNLSKYLSEEEVKDFLEGRHRPDDINAVEEIGDLIDLDGLKFNFEYQLSRTDFKIDDSGIRLGAGSFGTVYKGLVSGRLAALKIPNENCSKCTFKNILCEVKVLCHIGKHPNVVGFLGAYVKEIQKGILYIATELCSNGSLEAYLKKQKNVILRNGNMDYTNFQMERILYLDDLVRFCLEIAEAMDYIHGKSVVHGDLAARNVLLSENLTCKVGDFGLSRKVYEYQKYVKKSQDPLPWKWMAYESLTKMEFTRKSDVWSYGVTLWEIFSLGATPYGGLNWTVGFADELSNGLRLTRPKYEPEIIYLKMLECWHVDPNQRPAFSDVVQFLKCMSRKGDAVVGDYSNLLIRHSQRQ